MIRVCNETLLLYDLSGNSQDNEPGNMWIGNGMWICYERHESD